MLVVARLERHERAVVQHGGVDRAKAFAGTRARAGRHADLADLLDQSGVGSEGRRRPLRAARRGQHERGGGDTPHGFPSRTSRFVSRSNMRIRTTTPARRESTSRTWTSLRSSVGRYTIQLPAGATVAMPSQARDFGLGW